MQITNSTPPYKKPLYQEEDPATPDPEHQQTAQFPDDYKQKKQPSIGKVVGSNLDSPMSQERDNPYYEEERTLGRKKEVEDPVQSTEYSEQNELEKVIAYRLIFSVDGRPPCELNLENQLFITIEDCNAGKSDELITDFIGNRELVLYEQQPMSQFSFLRELQICKSVEKTISGNNSVSDLLDKMFN
ncbi:hypothetical protein AB4455_10560 [Vibrio sp. 10N.261.46.E12]|uniref:hypothetical protein n=1 Tax=unclassified Vibrio TaxID=2614977 RepID=UPI000977E0AB|nr:MULTISPECIES: hypothetical protein [unclassified Vibrio]OMO36088.1 hypothetical protein BH584_04760 [Vibrio sp. 10N.261.45.E1]PMJ34560.1 hypothetical protein BCU27_03775 [Vibrio sp. 10N.286.45.B6]PML88088.1 hypothetical protein BCT66_10845 [Vibrio sp. 10N.261.49.E11]PMM67416.1 hypothetical protein BCT48_15320 [Vibrio sp. 10N.261.46.F12]PMM81701.1 hypothetical protein BCT46_14940 [Vibrio sp. 10N.261.46.E8]